MSASLAFQKANRALLTGNAAVIALVPAENVLDVNARPEVSPKIVIGESDEFPADAVVGRYTNLTGTLHVWVKEPGLSGAKAIAGAIRAALNLMPWQSDGFRCDRQYFKTARFMRDPDGQTSHGIVTINAVIEEL